MRRVSVFSNQASNLIRLSLKGNRLTVSAQDIDFATSAVEDMACQYMGDELEIGFKSTFLVEILSNIQSGEVSIELSDASRAGLFIPFDKEDENEDVLMLSDAHDDQFVDSGMKLNLRNPLIFFDLETTGIDVAQDRIVEISFLKIYPNGDEESKTMKINPTVAIPPKVTAIHGITDEDVKDAPKFSEVGRMLTKVFEGCDFAGYNSNKFDLPLLAEEFCGPGWILT